MSRHDMHMDNDDSGEATLWEAKDSIILRSVSSCRVLDPSCSGLSSTTFLNTCWVSCRLNVFTLFLIFPRHLCLVMSLKYIGYKASAPKSNLHNTLVTTSLREDIYCSSLCQLSWVPPQSNWKSLDIVIEPLLQADDRKPTETLSTLHIDKQRKMKHRCTLFQCF